MNNTMNIEHYYIYYTSSSTYVVHISNIECKYSNNNLLHSVYIYSKQDNNI